MGRQVPLYLGILVAAFSTEIWVLKTWGCGALRKRGNELHLHTQGGKGGGDNIPAIAI